jgi:hypothetical protein
MKSWLCPEGHKNDYSSEKCFLCGSVSTVRVKEAKGPKKNSDKREEQMKLYLKKASLWKKGKTCLMCDWEGKKNTDVTPHHQKGREGELLLDFSKIIPLCPKHHAWATEHSKEAIELGISLPRNQKP